MLAVTDADEAARWYERALGARQLWNLGGVVELEVEGAPEELARVLGVPLPSAIRTIYEDHAAEGPGFELCLRLLSPTDAAQAVVALREYEVPFDEHVALHIQPRSPPLTIAVTFSRSSRCFSSSSSARVPSMPVVSARCAVVFASGDEAPASRKILQQR